VPVRLLACTQETAPMPCRRVSTALAKSGRRKRAWALRRMRPATP
jgi:hypothetical protein